MAISHEECVKNWAAQLTIEDVADVEIKKSGKKVVTFNHSKAAAACTSKLPIAFCYEYYGRQGLVWWDGQTFAYGTETILHNVFDLLAGGAVTKGKANAVFDLLRLRLLVLPGIVRGSGNERFALYQRGKGKAILSQRQRPMGATWKPRQAPED